MQQMATAPTAEDRRDALVTLVSVTDVLPAEAENPCEQLCAELDALHRDGHGDAAASLVLNVLAWRAKRTDVRVCLTAWLMTRKYRSRWSKKEAAYAASILPPKVAQLLLPAYLLPASTPV